MLSLVGGAVAAAALVPRVGPPAPAGLVCETAKSTSTSIALRWDRVVGADFYDLQCSGAGSQIFTKPFVSVGGPGTAGTVVSLLPNTTLTCQVRAHRFAATGFYHHNTLVGDWSELSAAKVQCATLAGTPSPPPAPSPSPSNPGDGRKTQMVQMWRVSEYNYTTEEDYLQNHDSGDLNGDAAVLSAVGFVMKPNVVLDKCAKAIRHVCPGLKGQTCMQCFEEWAMELQLANACNLQPNSKGGLPKTMLSIMQGCQSGFLFDMHTAILTSYCVEVVTDTPDCPTCTSPPNDGSQGYYGFEGSWSEYMSCNNGQQPQDSRCYCEGTADRQIGHQTTANVKSHCPNAPSSLSMPIVNRTASDSLKPLLPGQGRAGWLRGTYAQHLGLSGSREALSLRRAYLPTDQMSKPKPKPTPNRNSSDCVCSVQEMEDSRQFTGRNPIPLPWTWQPGGPTSHDIPFGNWYSSPRESVCVNRSTKSPVFCLSLYGNLNFASVGRSVRLVRRLVHPRRVVPGSNGRSPG